MIDDRTQLRKPIALASVVLTTLPIDLAFWAMNAHFECQLSPDKKAPQCGQRQSRAYARSPALRN
jgi:hypothetical protein